MCGREILHSFEAKTITSETITPEAIAPETITPETNVLSYCFAVKICHVYLKHCAVYTRRLKAFVLLVWILLLRLLVIELVAFSMRPSESYRHLRSRSFSRS